MISAFMTYETTLPSIPGDVYAGYGEDGSQIPPNLLASVYQGTYFSVVINFMAAVTSGSTVTYVNVDSVNTLENPQNYGLTLVKISNSSYRLSGTPSNVFSDEYCTFLMKDLTVLTLPIINNEEYFSVVEYHPPATKHTSRGYVFTAQYNGQEGVEISDVTVTQNYYWNYGVSLNTFTEAVSKGTK